jgi:hypothetical protein
LLIERELHPHRSLDLPQLRLLLAASVLTMICRPLVNGAGRVAA